MNFNDGNNVSNLFGSNSMIGSGLMSSPTLSPAMNLGGNLGMTQSQPLQNSSPMNMNMNEFFGPLQVSSHQQSLTSPSSPNLSQNQLQTNNNNALYNPEISIHSTNPATILSIPESLVGLDLEVQELLASWNSPRYRSIYRPYTANQIVTKRSRLRRPYISSLLATKLWNKLKYHQANKSAIMTFGVIDNIQAVHASKHLDAILVSGCHASVASCHFAEPSPNLADYPMSTVPLQVEHILMVQEFYDRKQRELHCNNTSLEIPSNFINSYTGNIGTNSQIDYLKPIIADIDSGHGGITTIMKLTRMLVERGSAGIQIEDQENGTHSSSNLQGRVVVPTSEHINRLVSIRVQLDIMGVDTVLISRTDTFGATLITSDLDKRDHPFLLGATQPLHRLVRVLEDAGNFGASDDKLLEIERNWVKEANLMTYIDTVAHHMQQKLKDLQKEELDRLIEDWKSKAKTLAIDDAKLLAKSMGLEVYWSAEHCRTPEGYYRYKGGVEAAISRAIDYSRFCDVVGLETDQPDYREVEHFATEVKQQCPDLMLSFNYPTSYNWDARGFSQHGLYTSNKWMAELGFNLQTIKAAGIHCDALMSDLFCKDFAQRGVIAFIERIQRNEKTLNSLNNNEGLDAANLHHITGAEFYNRMAQMVLRRNKKNPNLLDSADKKTFQALNETNFNGDFNSNYGFSNGGYSSIGPLNNINMMGGVNGVPDSLLFDHNNQDTNGIDKLNDRMKINELINQFSSTTTHLK